jgi:hypothetical protein
LLPVGLIQVIAMMSAATLVHRTSSAVLAPCAALCALSIWFYGRKLNA